jgi:hypothetical protein
MAASFLKSNVHVSGNIIPGSSNVYTLGSSNTSWKDVFVSSTGTLQLGNTALSEVASGGGVSLGGNTLCDALGSIDADRIGSGTLGTARIPDLDTSKITTGNFLVSSLDNGEVEVGSALSTAGGLIRFVGTGDVRHCMSFYYLNTSTRVGNITIRTASTTFQTTSDYRAKTNVRPMANALQRCLALKPVRFNWIMDPNGDEVDGFLAHEVKDVVKEAISGEKDAMERRGTVYSTGMDVLATDVEESVYLENEDGVFSPSTTTWQLTSERPSYQGIDQSKLVPLLTAALQDLARCDAELLCRVQALESAI